MRAIGLHVRMSPFGNRSTHLKNSNGHWLCVPALPRVCLFEEQGKPNRLLSLSTQGNGFTLNVDFKDMRKIGGKP